MDGIFHSQTQGMRKAINMSPVVFHINCLKIGLNNTIYNIIWKLLKDSPTFTILRALSVTTATILSVILQLLTMLLSSFANSRHCAFPKKLLCSKHLKPFLTVYLNSEQSLSCNHHFSKKSNNPRLELHILLSSMLSLVFLWRPLNFNTNIMMGLLSTNVL